MGFNRKGPDGNSPDGPDPPLYPSKATEPPPVPEEELRGLLKKPSKSIPAD